MKYLGLVVEVESVVINGDQYYLLLLEYDQLKMNVSLIHLLMAVNQVNAETKTNYESSCLFIYRLTTCFDNRACSFLASIDRSSSDIRRIFKSRISRSVRISRS